MKIAICAKTEDSKKIRKYTEEHCAECNCYPVVEVFESRESIIESMNENNYHIIIVAMDRAKGMEAVKHIHTKDRIANIIWFSDDQDFAGFAFENEVKQFAVRPINKETLVVGLERSGITNIENTLCRVHIKAEY